MIGRLRWLLLALAILVSPAQGLAAGGAPAPISSQENARVWMRSGAFIGARQPNAAKGVNASSFVTIQHPSGQGILTAIVKGSTTGVATIQRLDGHGAFTLVPPNAQYIREAAASHLDETLHIGFVPATARRVIDGEPSSVQLVVTGATPQAKLAPNDRMQLNRGAAEKLRVFDYVLGNRDRHYQNILVYARKGEYQPVAIDNGLTLPEGAMSPDRFSWPMGLTKNQSGPLLPQTKALIASMDIRAVAQTLARSGVSRVATVNALRRIERLKLDPSFLELDAQPNVQTNAFVNLPKVSAMGAVADQGLPPDTLKRIDAVVTETHGAVH